jgi:hypothetical protein
MLISTDLKANLFLKTHSHLGEPIWKHNIDLKPLFIGCQLKFCFYSKICIS